MLTRKHFRELGRIAGLIYSDSDRQAVEAEMIALFAKENPLFNERRFRAHVSEEYANHQRAIALASRG